MGAGASSQPQGPEKTASVSGIPGVNSKGQRGTLNRAAQDYFLYWSDLEPCGLKEADGPAFDFSHKSYDHTREIETTFGQLERAVKAVVEANNSVLDAWWTAQDKLCQQYNVCQFTLQSDGSTVKPVVKKQNRILEQYEIDDMLQEDIMSGDDPEGKKINQFKKFWDDLQEANGEVTKYLDDDPEAQIDVTNGHSILLTRGGKMIMANETQKMNHSSFLLGRQLVVESLALGASSVGCMLKPCLDRLQDLKNKGEFKIFRVVMSFFQEGEVVDGCVDCTIEPDPLTKSGMSEYKEVYTAVFGKEGLFRALNRSIALVRAAHKPVKDTPRKVTHMQKKNWLEKAKKQHMDEQEMKELPRRLAGNINKLKSINVLEPATVSFVSSVFCDLHLAFRTSGLLPAPVAVDALPEVKMDMLLATVELKNSAQAQADAEKRGRGRGAGEGPPAGVSIAIGSGVAAAAAAPAAEDPVAVCAAEDPPKVEPPIPPEPEAAAEETPAPTPSAPVVIDIAAGVQAAAADDDDGA